MSNIFTSTVSFVRNGGNRYQDNELVYFIFCILFFVKCLKFLLQLFLSPKNLNASASICIACERSNKQADRLKYALYIRFVRLFSFSHTNTVNWVCSQSWLVTKDRLTFLFNDMRVGVGKEMQRLIRGGPIRKKEQTGFCDVSKPTPQKQPVNIYMCI